MSGNELSPHALMLRDTVLELLHHLDSAAGGDSNYDQGYRQGLGYAIDVLKMQCETFGLADDLKLPPLDFYR